MQSIHISNDIACKILSHKIQLKDEIRYFHHWRLCEECREILWNNRGVNDLYRYNHFKGAREEAFIVIGEPLRRNPSVGLEGEETPFQIICDRKAVILISLSKSDFELKVKKLKSLGFNLSKGEVPEFAENLKSNLEIYFTTGRPFKYPEINGVLINTQFATQALLWTSLVPFGCKVTYGEIARWVGSPKYARGVGVVLKSNPIPIVIPCHRVIRYDGKLGGYAAGIRLKERLLDIEDAFVKSEL